DYGVVRVPLFSWRNRDVLGIEGEAVSMLAGRGDAETHCPIASTKAYEREKVIELMKRLRVHVSEVARPHLGLVCSDQLRERERTVLAVFISVVVTEAQVRPAGQRELE